MNISICITVFNEEGSIAKLLDSLLTQTKSAEEIVIVDGGSTDKTVSIIRQFQKKYKKIRLLVKKCTRSQGRNLSVKMAKNPIIAITDAGCIADKNWLKEITLPFKDKNIDIVAGYYIMKGKTSLQTAMGVFLGTTPGKFNEKFLPSARSMAFRKSAWQKAGGFPESRYNSAEDTDFNYKALKLGLNYSRVKTAVVEWGMPNGLKGFFNKIKDYSSWDIQFGIWWHPVQRLASHNIKSLFVLFRYFTGIILLLFSIYNTSLLPLFGILILLYLFWSFYKVFREFKRTGIAIYGPLLQITADLGVIIGFVNGIFQKYS